MDRNWWTVHYAEAKSAFSGRLITISDWGKSTERVRDIDGRNSGAGALCLAAQWGAQKIILLGYDCQYAEDGARHWHGDHPRQLGNCVSINRFVGQFKTISDQLGGIDVINASRRTALNIWPKMSLQEAMEKSA